MKVRIVGFGLALVCLLSACGGSSQAPDASAKKVQKLQRAQQIRPRSKQQASSYEVTVQSLYVAYFGRPADPGGLANFESALSSVNAPTDVDGLAQAYATDPTVKNLIDAFGSSTESQTLYGSGTTTQFVQAVFNNVLGRQPAQAGLDFWVNAIDGGTLSQGDAALAIMAGGLTNSSTQGLLDAQLISNRLSVASNFTYSIATSNAPTSYAGANAAQTARALLAGVTASTSPPAYQSNVDAAAAAIEASGIASYPLRAAFSDFIRNGFSIDFSIAGICNGSEKVTTRPASSTTFDGVTGYAASSLTTVGAVDCSNGIISETATAYYDTDFAPIGIVSQSGPSAMVGALPAPLPEYVSEGNTAVYATMTRYSDQTFATPVGQDVYSYRIEADGASTNSVLYIATVNSYDNANLLVQNTQTTYRLNDSAQLTVLSISDHTYSPRVVTESITPVSQNAQLTCNETRHGGTNGLGFYTPSGYTAYTVSNGSANSSELSTLTWGVSYDNPALSNGAYTGSLRASLWAFQTSYTGALASGYQLGVFYPTFTGQFAESTNQIYNFGYSTSDIVSSATGTNPNGGQYCIVAFLEQYDTSQYWSVDWVQFPGVVTFQ